MDGVLVVDKPEGPTSHDVVAWCRRRLGTRAVGHAGTLDPMATGVLVLVIGRATRLAQFLSGQPKAYDATIRLGVTTDTWDRTGTAVAPPHAGPWPDAAAVSAALSGLAGTRPQIPPPFSAKKIEGERAHRLARRGQEVRVEPAVVELSACDILAVEPPLVRVRLRCSAGFYVRSLAHELGQALGCGACLENLRRTASGAFTLAEAAALTVLDADPAVAAARVVPPELLLPDFPAVRLDEAAAARAAHGNDVTIPGGAEAGRAILGARSVRLLAPDGSLLAMARPTDRPGVLHPAVVLK
jgi:tRNA pseudouridine55 synthase